MLSSMSPVPLKVFESYCFMKSTYTHVKTSTNQSRVAHPGVHGGAVNVIFNLDKKLLSLYVYYLAWISNIRK